MVGRGVIRMDVSGGVGLTEIISTNSGGFIGQDWPAAEERTKLADYSVVERRYGLPWRSMVYYTAQSEVFRRWSHSSERDSRSWIVNVPLRHRESFGSFAGGMELPDWVAGRLPGRTVPLRPVWSGFLYSTLVYSMAIWASVGAWRFLHERERQGRAPSQWLNGVMVWRVAVCLGLGCASTVVATWASVLLGRPLPSVSRSITTQYGSDDIDFEFMGWFGYSSSSWEDRFASFNPSAYSKRGTGPSGKVFYETRIVPQELSRDYQYGFPFRAMTIVSGDGSSGLPWDDAELKAGKVAADGGIDVPPWLPARFQDRKLPLRPMWPGFLYSTLMYGAFAWVLLFMPGVMRKRLRARRGLCLECAYPLGDFAICPECGKPTGREA